MNPRLTDNDAGEISVTLDGRELRGWSYANDGERRQKMLQAREYVEGWCDAAERSRPVTAGAEIDADLLQRCKELLQWGRTGLLNGGSGGAIRALAAKYEAQGIRELYAMSIAESKTKDEAMEALIKMGDSAVTPQDRGSPQ